ncbi:MAG: hypothetical protein ABFC55_04970 [Tenuifilaceae bacterium]
MNKKVTKPSPEELRKAKRLKTIPFIIVAIAIVIVLVTWIKPDFHRDIPVLDEPEISQAIMTYANTQMKKALLELPAEATEIRVEKVLVHELSKLPGSQENRRVLTTLIGSYQLPEREDDQKRITFKLEKMKFKLERRYPEGINVQVYTGD